MSSTVLVPAMHSAARCATVCSLNGRWKRFSVLPTPRVRLWRPVLNAPPQCLLPMRWKPPSTRKSDMTPPIISPESFEALRRMRAAEPTMVAERFKQRRKRELLGEDGKLFIVAADHPARGALAVGDNE